MVTKNMEMKLTSEESEEYFYNALCNALGTGYMKGYGLELTFKDNQYAEAKLSLLKKEKQDYCYEDILMEILHNGGVLIFEDIEDDDDYTRSITLKDVHDRVQKTNVKHLMNMINEEDDVVTADIILQTVFFENVIFG